MSQIIDLFPMLKELHDKGPHDAFYVVKVWVKKTKDQMKSFFLHQQISLGQYELSRECCEHLSLFILVKRSQNDISSKIHLFCFRLDLVSKVLKII